MQRLPTSPHTPQPVPAPWVTPQQCKAVLKQAAPSTVCHLSSLTRENSAALHPRCSSAMGPLQHCTQPKRRKGQCEKAPGSTSRRTPRVPRATTYGPAAASLLDTALPEPILFHAAQGHVHFQCLPRSCPTIPSAPFERTPLQGIRQRFQTNKKLLRISL